jgi:hypothetical protein
VPFLIRRRHSLACAGILAKDDKVNIRPVPSFNGVKESSQTTDGTKVDIESVEAVEKYVAVSQLPGTRGSPKAPVKWRRLENISSAVRRAYATWSFGAPVKMGELKID